MSKENWGNFAIARILPNVPNGAFWGYATMADCQIYAENIKENKNIKVYKLAEAGGKDAYMALVETTPAYMLNEVMAKDEDFKKLTEKDKKGYIEEAAAAQAIFEKWLIKNAADYYGLVGIYCINDTPSITYEGHSYPAFKVGIQKALNLMKKYGYQVQTQEGLIPLTNVNGEIAQKVMKSMFISPTHTGSFLKVKGTLTAAKVAEIKKAAGIR
jgi:intein/homing endonuclease